MDLFFYFLGFAIAVVILFLSNAYWKNKYEKMGINISYKKYNDYIKNKYVYFCYNDNNFILSNQLNKIIIIENGVLKYDNIIIKLDLIKKIKYSYVYPFKLNRSLFDIIKVYIYLKNDDIVNLIPPPNMEIWYKLSFILVVSMIINNYTNNKFNLVTHIKELEI